jgi:hypothetical protein
MHVAPECLGQRLIGAKATSFSVIVPTVTLVARAVLGVHSFIFPSSPMVCRKLKGSAQVARSKV